LIAHCHKVRRDNAVVCLFDSRGGERPRDEFSTGRVGGREWLVRVHRSTVIFRAAELVSRHIL
jgi:hypothetical protein